MYTEPIVPALLAAKSCTVSSPLGSHIVAGSNPACSAGGSLASGGTCHVKCDVGYSPDSGTTAYSCSAGSLTSPTVVCSRECPVSRERPAWGWGGMFPLILGLDFRVTQLQSVVPFVDFSFPPGNNLVRFGLNVSPNTPACFNIQGPVITSWEGRGCKKFCTLPAFLKLILG